jgi:E3 ubiquitin-protein ligase SHPRH
MAPPAAHLEILPVFRQFLRDFLPRQDDHDISERPAKRARLDDPDSQASNWEAILIKPWIPIKSIAFRLHAPDRELLRTLLDVPFTFHWTQQEEGDPEVLKGWSFHDKHLFTLYIEDDATSNIDWQTLNTIIKTSYLFIRKPIKNYDSMVPYLSENAYFVRSRFQKDPTNEDIFLNIDLVWRDGASMFDLPKQGARDRARKLFKEVYQAGVTYEPWLPQDFYHNAFLPPADMVISAENEIDKATKCTLYPYQKRTVQFMMNREGVLSNEESARTLSLANDYQHANGFKDMEASYESRKDSEGRQYFVSGAIGRCSRVVERCVVKGGILAEEMGLGKTLELITLISVHRRPPIAPGFLEKDTISGKMLPPSKATLVVTPKHLFDQWSDELALHAPHLKVKKYTGQKHEDVENLHKDADVVLATYDCLSRDFWYVQAQKDHGLRHARKNSPPVNPLVGRIWWRVCLDEAQMIDKGVSQSATVANKIPRVHSWAVSGTPFKKVVEDLRGLLMFLRYHPFHETAIWKRIDRSAFRDIIHKITIRHSKDKVRNEIKLPPQRRIAVTIPFMALEEQNYESLFQQMYKDCGFTVDGKYKEAEETSHDWIDNPVAVEKMKSWLERLRQTCLHPHVGRKNRRAMHVRGGDQTIDSVLKSMIRTHVFNICHRQRQLVEAILAQGHVLAYHKTEPNRASISLSYYQRALDVITSLVKLCEETQAQNGEEDLAELPEATTRTKTMSGATNMKQQLKLALELQHAAYFFVATAYFNIKDNAELTEKDSDEFKRLELEETSNYEEAKQIRKHLLKDARIEAETAMKRVEELKALSFKDAWFPEKKGGLESNKFIDDYLRLAEILNLQVPKLNEWRSKIIEVLLKPLIDTDKEEELTGEEYEESTNVQSELYALFRALKTITEDRKTVFTGRENQDVIESIKLAATALRQTEMAGVVDPDPTNRLFMDLIKDRDQMRAVLPFRSIDGENGIISGLRSSQHSLDWRRSGMQGEKSTQSRLDIEILIIRAHLVGLSEAVKQETERWEMLDKQVNVFRNCMNDRLSYYSRLQALSDMVQPYKEHLTEEIDQSFMTAQMKKEEAASAGLKDFEDKLRFLQHLKDTASEEKSKECIICRDTIELGVLTICGHQYCKDCLKGWFSQKHSCPLCKKNLTSRDLQTVNYRARDLRATATEDASGSKPSASNSDAKTEANSILNHAVDTSPVKIYSAVDSETLRSIQATHLPLSYSTKTDTILRLILHLRRETPDVKVLLFSQNNDFLSLLSTAFDSLNVSHLSYAPGAARKFRRDSDIAVLLLDARSDASGLNLTCATHVILCEPLLSVGVEVQAVARVHRIGQMRETTIWMVLIADTVEEAVYCVAGERRAAYVAEAAKEHQHEAEDEHMQRRNGFTLNQTNGSLGAKEVEEAAILAANSLQIETAVQTLTVKRGGENVDSGDLWRCLFSGAHRVMEESHGRPNGVVVPINDMQRIVRAEAAEIRRDIG